MKHYRPFLMALTWLGTLVLSSFILEKPSEAPPYVGDIVNLDTVQYHLSDCAAKGTLCLPISLGQALTFQITDNGVPVQLDLDNGCDFDTSSAYTYSTLFGMGDFGPYELTSWPVSGQKFSGTFDSIPDLVDSMNVWDPTGNWTLNASNLLILGGDPAQNYDTMKVWVTQIQTPSFIGYNLGITPRGTELAFDRGFHEIILNDPINNMADTFYIHATCSETVDLTIGVDSMETVCVDFSDFIGVPSGLSFCTPPPTGIADFTIMPNDSCIKITGLSPGLVSACAVLCDDRGFCDTTLINVRVKQYGAADHINVEITEGETGFYCLDTTGFYIDQMSFSICDTSNNGYADLTIDNLGFCINYEGLMNGGTDTICTIACDELGNCDTTYLNVHVNRNGPDMIFDTLLVNFSDIHCVDRSRMKGTLDSLYAIQVPDGAFASLKIDELAYCIDYTGLQTGTDTFGLALRDETGLLDTTYLFLTVVEPTSDIVIDTLLLGETTIYCLPTSELAGTSYSVTNICADNNGNFTTFALDTLSLCVEVVAMQAGTDTACYVICDDLGACDTLIFYISAIGSGTPTPPNANPDVTVTPQGEPVDISVLENDILNGAISDIIVMPASNSIGPIEGTTSVNLVDGIITYTPDADFCGSTDNFMYLMCNDTGCDTALVTVMVLCESLQPLVFYEGFSPNGDDINETFVIENAEQYDGTRLTIYNRWGNMVYQKKNYKNNNSAWDGTWEGKALPDGTYFYIFTDGLGNTFKGQSNIRR